MASFIFSFSQTAQHLGVLGYWIVFFAAFLESLVFIGALFPGGTIIIIAGFLSAQGYIDVGDLIWFAATGSILGDGVSYWLGTKGTRFFHNENKILKLSHIEKGREFFKKHGDKSVFLGRHFGPLRAIVPFLAGLSKMDIGTFLFWNVVSAFSFAISYLFAGYIAAKTIKATVGIWSTRMELFLFLFFLFALFVWFLAKKSRYFFTSIPLTMLKRLFDILFSSLILTVFSPLLLLIAFAIKMESEGPVFYKGRRVGRYEKIFYMNKFRTMVVNADKIGGPTTSDDDRRVTRIGKILRKYKLDELPQFINVFKGEMSVVGPRPDVEDVVILLPEEEKKHIFSVRPGITDFASLAFPNEGEIVKGAKDPHKAYLEKIWPTKVKLQLKYIEEQSFWTDVKIILKTIKTVIL